MDVNSIFDIIIQAGQAATQAAVENKETVQAAAETVSEAGHAEEGLLGTLGINWKLFLAQLFNFGVILFILWKWVFGPVANKLQHRTDRIEKAMNDAQTITREKEEFMIWKQNAVNEARKEASLIVGSAQTEAVKVKEQILQQAKEDQIKLVEQARSQIEQDKQEALRSAKAEIADMVTSASEKILRKKLDDKGDRELISEVLKSV
jgi:F-type H+-transporting ATPase subunit b